MADYTERQILELAVTGTEQVEASARAFLAEDEAMRRARVGTYDLAESAKDAGKKVYELANSVQVVSARAPEANAALKALVASMTAASTASLDLNKFSQQFVTTNHVVEAGTTGVRNYSQNITGLSYAMNDALSVSGGLDQRLNALANNLPMLLAGFGGVGAALSAIVPLGAMVIRNWDDLATFWRDRNPFLLAEHSAEQMARAVAKDKDELEKLQAATTLSNAGLERMAELTGAVAKAERELEAQRTLEKTKATPDEGQKARAAEFGKTVDELGGEQVVKGLLDNLTKGYARAENAMIQMATAGAGKGTALAAAYGGLPGPGVLARAQVREERDRERLRKEARADADREREAENKRAETLNREGAENQKIGDQAAEDDRQKEQREARERAERNRDEARKRFNKQADEEVKAADATPLDEHATARASEMQAGGVDETKAFIRLATEIQAELGRVRPGSDPDALRKAAGQMAQEAIDRAKAGATANLFRVQVEFPGAGANEAGAEAVRRQALAARQAAALAGPLPAPAPAPRRPGVRAPRPRRVGPKRPNQGEGFRSVPVSPPPPPAAVPPAVVSSAAKGAENTDKALQAIAAIAAVQARQGQRFDQLLRLIPGGLAARTAAPVGRG